VPSTMEKARSFAGLLKNDEVGRSPPELCRLLLTAAGIACEHYVLEACFAFKYRYRVGSQ
jgi:hypothetical protein